MSLLAGSFLWYLGEFIVLVLVAVLGIFIGKELRKRKDKKQEKEALNENE